jgi:uncharacterized membrane protein (DUF373 family)
MAESKEPKNGAQGPRKWIVAAFTTAEDIIYVGLGCLLAASGLTFLVTELFQFLHLVVAGKLSASIVPLLDRLLLIVIIVEVLLTVKVSFREHILQPQPFLIVGLIAVTRRILVLTAELPTLIKESEEVFRGAMLELALLTVLVVALVFSLRLLRHQDQKVEA